MKRRLKKYFLYLFIRYVPSTSKIAKHEAKILAQYVFDNFSEEERLMIVSEMRVHLTDLISAQIIVKEHEVNQQILELEFLKKNLNKLNPKK